LNKEHTHLHKLDGNEGGEWEECLDSDEDEEEAVDDA